MKVIVVGAGAAGLAATNALRKKGIDVTALESRSEAGGRARCYSKEGFTLDTGAQFLARICKTQLRLSEEMGISPEILPFHVSAALWRNGKMHPISMKPSNLAKFRGLPLSAYPQMAILIPPMLSRYFQLDYKNMSFDRLLDLGETSVADFVRKHSGNAALEWVMEPLVETLTLGEATDVSIPHIICLIGLYKGLLLMEKGIGSLPAALYRKNKDVIRLSTTVNKIVLDNGRVKGVETSEGFMDADHIICATTAGAARKIIPDLPEAMRKPLETIKYSSTVHVMVALEKRLLPGNLYACTLPPRANSFLSGLNDCSGKSSYFAPDGCGLSHCVTYGRHTRAFMKLSDDEVVRRTMMELQRFVPDTPNNPIFADVIRWDEAICLEYPGQPNAMYCLKKNHLHDVKGLHLAGEYMYLVSCVEGALLSGEDAAGWVLHDM
ncbi:MAG: FAD-dependent oxidoreductase [Actinobacteria bacterium]|nr:FAD-dependent oxidoreductase [Actinomycetota bacterium]